MTDFGIRGNNNILSVKECYYVVKYLETVEKDDLWSPSTDPYWDRKTIEIGVITEPQVRNILKKAYSAIKSNLPEGFDASTSRIVVWSTGTWADVHTDDIYYGREYSSIVYLNQDFDGGFTVFPDQGVSVQPRTGSGIIFQGTSEYPHQVTEVTRGTRYALTSFWTNNVEHMAYRKWDEDGR